MIKKFLRSISLITAIGVFLCTGTYAFTLTEESAVTQKGTLYGDNPVAENITGGESNDFAKVETSGSSMIFTPNTVTGNSRGVIGKIEVPQSATWEDSGCVEVTLDWKNEGTVKSGDWWYFGLIPETYNGTTVKEAPARDFMWKIFTVETAQPDGVTRSVKYVYDYSDSNIHLTIYTKNPGDADYVKLKETDLGMTAAKGYKKIADIVPIVYFGNNKGSDFKTTISNVKITEKQTSAELEDISGNYLSGDKKSVSYYLPEGYTSASLEFDGKTLVSFEKDTDAYGCYKTEIDFSKFEKGNSKALKLIVDGVTVKEYSINIAELITEPSFTDVAGDYKSTDTITLSYKIPQAYKSAVLKIGENVIKTYESTKQNGGEFTYDLKLADYADCIGEDIPISLTVSYDDKADDVFESLVNISLYYPEAILADLEGEYFSGDKIDISYTLPTDYIEAKLTLAGNTVASFDPTKNPAGPGKISAEIGETSGDSAEICLTVKESGGKTENLKKSVKVYNMVVSNNIMTETFESDLTMSIGKTATVETFNGSKVFSYEFTKDGETERGMVDKTGLSLSRDWFIELSYDVYLTEENMETGIYLQDVDGSCWYGAYVLQKNGLFGMKYEANKFYNIKYRVVQNQYTESGKLCVLVYVDGKYVGKEYIPAQLGSKGTETKNIVRIAIDYRNGAKYAKGKIYIDNVNISVAAPKYSVKVQPLDKDGNAAEKADPTAAAAKLVFSQQMSTSTVNDENVTLTSFNGAKIPVEFTFDESGKEVTVKAKESLVGGSEYTLSIGKDVTSMVGTKNEKEVTLKFSTDEKGQYVENATVTGGISSITPNKEVTVKADLKNKEASTLKGRAFAVMYAGKQMVSMNFIDVDEAKGSDSKDIKIKAPAEISGEIEIAVFFAAGTDDFAVTDICVAR